MKPKGSKGFASLSPETKEIAALLTKAKTPKKDYNEITEALTKSNQRDNKAKLLSQLFTSGMPLKGNLHFVIQVIGFSGNVDNLYQSLETLINAGLSVKKEKPLFESFLDENKTSPEMANAFSRLHKAGLTFAKHKRLYDQLAELRVSVDTKAEAIIILYENELDESHNQLIYYNLLGDSQLSTDRAKLIIEISRFGLSSKAMREISIPILRSYSNFSNLSKAFTLLYASKFDEAYEGKLGTYLLNDLTHCVERAEAFLSIKPILTNEKKALQLIDALLAVKSSPTQMAHLLLLLDQEGFTYDLNPEFYGFLSDKVSEDNLPHLIHLVDIATHLKVMDSQSCQLFDLTLALCDHKASTESRLMLLCQLYQKCPEVFARNLSEVAIESMVHMLVRLDEAGLAYPLYAPIYEKLLTLIHEENFDQFSYFQLIKEICHDVKHPTPFHGLMTFTGRLGHFHDRIARVQSNEAIYALGPLNKNSSTLAIESLLDHMKDPDYVERSSFAYENEAYWATLPNTNRICLSELIRNANLNHLSLSTEQINALGNLLKLYIPLRHWDPNTDNELLKLLPEEQRGCIAIYITEFYKNINLFFRGEPFTLDELIVAHEEEQIIVNLIIGCLTIDAINKLPHLVSLKRPEVEIFQDLAKSKGLTFSEFYTEYQYKTITLREFLKDCLKDKSLSMQKLSFFVLSLMDRDTTKNNPILLNIKHALTQSMPGENLDFNGSAPHEGLLKKVESFLEQNRQNLEDALYLLSDVLPDTDELVPKGPLIRKEKLDEAILQKREAQPWRFPSLTSFSHKPNGSSWISGKKTRVNHIEELGFCINPNEGEILFSHGTQVQSVKRMNGVFFSKIFRTPTLEPIDTYWSDLALHDAFVHFLQNAYKDTEETYESDEYAVERPNHGLAHTYRNKVLIDHVVLYFSFYAKEPAFKEFCQSMDPKLMELLHIAGCFLVTGRESEVGALDNAELYKKYRQASADNFMAFIKKYPSLPHDPNHLAPMHEAILYMGHPDYESKLNTGPSEESKAFRNHLFMILSIAHKLDLLRCYGPDKYADRVDYIKEKSRESKDQKHALLQMIHYNESLIKAHGDMQHTTLTLDGKFIRCAEKYRPPFGAVSASIKKIREVSEMIRKPQLKPFEDTTPKDPRLSLRKLR